MSRTVSIQANPSTEATDDGPPASESPNGSAAGVPERPALADGVELSGEMEDSAYEEQPWMIVRNGDFVTVTELLYRIAEQADGQRSLADIANAVSDATDRAVSEDNIRQLVGDRLIPLGLIVGADGTVAKVAGGATRSPLQIGMRTAQVPGRILEPLAQAFKILFAPPILLGVVAVGLVALAWVFLVHGLGESFRGAVYEPWLILVLLPIVVASAAFHEFGHAAALSYGGGRVRGMGAGIYTIYPVFFTDVTDNYRLKRWARVRTDLGGFHFNLVFAIGIVGLYLATGHAFLLLAVLAIALSIVQQAIPIVRLDGYWALADMTGIPDPLSYIKPFLKSLLPVPAWRDERVPPMKRWATAVFLLWMAITIPLLLVLGVYMLATAPRVIGTAVDSFQRNAQTLGDAVGRGDALTALASLVGIGVLLLTSLAFAWFVIKTIRGLLGRLWRWAGDDDRRRVAAGGITLAMAGALLFLWAPPLPFLGTPPGLFHDFRPIAAGERLTILTAIGLVPDEAPAAPSGGGAPGAQPPPGDPGQPQVPPIEPPVVPPLQPPVEVPPVEEPPVEVPPLQPPVEVPTVDVPPVTLPPVTLPPVTLPPVDPIESPLVSAPPVESALPSVAPPASVVPEASGLPLPP